MDWRRGDGRNRLAPGLRQVQGPHHDVSHSAVAIKGGDLVASTVWCALRKSVSVLFLSLSSLNITS
jgi:hypothetical protein